MTAREGFIDSVYCGSGVDGKGLRVVVFFSGCNLRCKFCHNPETLYKKGNAVTAEEVYKKCLKYKAYIRRGGVTLSGGEPFLQKEFCLQLIKLLHSANIHILTETNGQLADEELILANDGFIVDVKNQETDDLSAYDKFLSLCDKFKKPVTLTNVLIPEVNGEKEKIRALSELKSRHECVERIKFLPFHKMCAEKYERLGEKFLYSDKREPTDDDLSAAYESL